MDLKKVENLARSIPRVTLARIVKAQGMLVSILCIESSSFLDFRKKRAAIQDLKLRQRRQGGTQRRMRRET